MSKIKPELLSRYKHVSVSLQTAREMDYFGTDALCQLVFFSNVILADL